MSKEINKIGELIGREILTHGLNLSIYEIHEQISVGIISYLTEKVTNNPYTIAKLLGTHGAHIKRIARLNDVYVHDAQDDTGIKPPLPEIPLHQTEPDNGKIINPAFQCKNDPSKQF